MANPGPFVGTWNGHDRDFIVSGDESANLNFSASAAPGSRLMLHITMVVTTGSTSVASATVKSTNDPAYPVGKTLTFTLKNDVIASDFGTFCDAKSQPTGRLWRMTPRPGLGRTRAVTWDE